MKKILALSLLAATTAAFAQGSGFYAGGSVGQSHTKFKTEDFSQHDPHVSESKKENTLGWKLFGGYNFNQYLAIEAGYADLGDAKYKYAGNGPLLAGLTGQAKAEQSSWFAAAKGTWPINDQFNVFGKLGATRNHMKMDVNFSANGINFSSSDSKNRIQALLGIGAEYKLTKQIAFRTEYEYFGQFGNEEVTGRTKVGLWSAGVTYSF